MNDLEIMGSIIVIIILLIALGAEILLEIIFDFIEKKNDE